jgi:hypothetical protein
MKRDKIRSEELKKKLGDNMFEKSLLKSDVLEPLE